MCNLELEFIPQKNVFQQLSEYYNFLNIVLNAWLNLLSIFAIRYLMFKSQDAVIFRILDELLTWNDTCAFGTSVWSNGDLIFELWPKAKKTKPISLLS